MTGRKQCVEFGGERSEMVGITVGSPQGSVISPLLFLLLTADMEEWVTEGATLTYADDTTCYAAADSREEVRQILTKSAIEILAFMSANRLAANPSKTKFVFFGRRAENPLKVGDTWIKESKEEELLGLIISKSLTWKAHIDRLEGELRKRIGILRRLAWKIPRDIAINLIEPVFTSKLRYGLELVANAKNPEDMAIKRLEMLHKSALRAATGTKRRGVPYNDLLAQTNQMPIRSIAENATAMLAWKCAQNWSIHPLMQGRVETHKSLRETRQRNTKDFPPQLVGQNKSIIPRVLITWDAMPSQIKEETKLLTARRMIRKWTGL